jgi:hypothetical protein
MVIRIIGTNHDEKHLEYILEGDFPAAISFDSIRNKVLDDLASVLKKDHDGFIFFNSSFPASWHAKQERVTIIHDPIKDNFSASVRVDGTLYSQYKKLVITSYNLDEQETLDGTLVRVYLDKFVRKILPSEETIRFVDLGDFRATVLSSA